MIKGLGNAARHAAVAAVLVMTLPAQAANGPVGGAGSWQEVIQVRFDSSSRQTRVAGKVSSDLCFSFHLPQEWRSKAEGFGGRLKANFSDAELDVTLRSARDLQGMSQPDLASRDAAVLQQDYENLLGRPAQSISLASLDEGASRWSATWFDANLPSASHGLTVEALIVPLSKDWVLELSPSNIDVRGDYDALVQTLLRNLRVQHRPDC
jgi:hypothetical protein